MDRAETSMRENARRVAPSMMLSLSDWRGVESRMRSKESPIGMEGSAMAKADSRKRSREAVAVAAVVSNGGARHRRLGRLRFAIVVRLVSKAGE